MDKKAISRIHIKQGDITKLEVDAIVNAANTSLLGGGGVDGAIHRAAGPELLAECRTIGGCPTGEARITKGYNLKAAYVIHTAGPVYGKSGNSAELLRRCYESCMKIAVDHHIRTIAFPAISCGVYRYPIQEACEIALGTTIPFLEQHSSFNELIFILFSDSDARIYQDRLQYWMNRF
ncbi:MAG: O-acetyl-ADP-ribose deacetylase [Desulfobacterales bacterium]